MKPKLRFVHSVHPPPEVFRILEDKVFASAISSVVFTGLTAFTSALTVAVVGAVEPAAAWPAPAPTAARSWKSMSSAGQAKNDKWSDGRTVDMTLLLP